MLPLDPNTEQLDPNTEQLDPNTEQLDPNTEQLDPTTEQLARLRAALAEAGTAPPAGPDDAGIVPMVRAGGPVDVLGGVRARIVAAPGSTAQAAALLRAAAELGLTVGFRGGGSRSDWGNPPRALDLLVETRRLTGVVEHAAGDLIAVVRAGIPLADLQRALAPAGQQLGLDDPVGGATVGGAVACNGSGPRRMLYGTVRDLLIGVTMVRADGVVAHAGGKVVKNVAGYDLGKLVTGAYGTLGLVTECVFRLHPVPAARAYLRCRVDAGRGDGVADGLARVGRLLGSVLGAQLVPAALEVDAPPEGGHEVVLLLEGTPAGVAGRAEAAARLLGTDKVTGATAPPWWGRYPWQPGDTGLKLTGVLSGVPDLLAAGRAAADRHDVPVGVRGSAGTGVLYAGLPAAADPDRVARVVEELRGAATEVGGHAVVLTAPEPVRDRVDLWGPVEGLELMRRVKQRFDPDARLAPGRFVGGI
ncbi:FAD-binding oxidoreductase [Micromonospora sp. WMMD1102]|uniref:FAD-binding oxidoreductase n=1 Tax=Micromonospora sp. WMMD1102 TaxID=3016105 RepID=UPI002414E423|nr:FAD-binding oxidoreductase [Micromonospora sp. WMMD1102]MDG4785215.1 FAD-binding oxidoreductase [Micromonospora sp. WMMD1102]